MLRKDQIYKQSTPTISHSKQSPSPNPSLKLCLELDHPIPIRAAIRKMHLAKENKFLLMCTYPAAGRAEPVALHKALPIICVHLSKFSFRKRSDLPFSQPHSTSLDSPIPGTSQKKKDAKERQLLQRTEQVLVVPVPIEDGFNKGSSQEIYFHVYVDPGSSDRKFNNGPGTP
ncbi:hypothetical protein E5D57_011887 [Metarhizium anisopliae]|nr:hypothetical protein E5D57_011887 [Metarhizium anisopliae]